MNVVQRFIHVDMLLGGRAHHSAEQLCDVGVIYGATEGHHGLSSGAVPAGGERFLEENNLDALIVGDSAWLAVRHIQSADLKSWSAFSECVDNLSFHETVADPFFYDPQALIQIGRGDLMSAAVLHLHDKDGVYLSVVLLIAILVPVITLMPPFVCRSLQNSHIITGVLGVGDYDPILQKAGCTHFVRSGLHIVCRGLNTLRQSIETLRRCGHADNYRHRGQTICLGAFQELLHDRRVLCEISCTLRTAMGFVNDEIQPVGFLAYRIRQRLPNGVLPAVRVFGKIA